MKKLVPYTARFFFIHISIISGFHFELVIADSVCYYYTNFISVHGFPEIMKPLDVSLKANLISITLQLASENGGLVEKTFRKKFSRSLLVYKLINIIKRLFNIDSTRPKVICLSSGVSAFYRVCQLVIITIIIL